MYGVSTEHMMPTTLLRASYQQHSTRTPTWDALKVSSQHDGFDLQSSRGQFGDQRITHSANSQLIAQCPNQHDGASGERSLLSVLRRDEAKETKHEKHAAEAAKTIQVERSELLLGRNDQNRSLQLAFDRCRDSSKTTHQKHQHN